MNDTICKNLLLTGIFVALFVPLVSIWGEAQPIIEGMDYSPRDPVPLSTVTFKAGVNGQDVNVYVFVEECRDDLCYADVQNVSMELTEGNRYEKGARGVSWAAHPVLLFRVHAVCRHGLSPGRSRRCSLVPVVQRDA